MFDKCIKCPRLGESCVPNLMLLPFNDLIRWCDNRQKYLGWTNQVLAYRCNVPIGTINRIKAGEYHDCKYSTIKYILITLIGGTSDEFSCTEQITRELQQMEELEQQVTKARAIEKENEALKARLEHIDELHRQDVRAVREEYQRQVAFLKEETDFLKEQLRAWQSR